MRVLLLTAPMSQLNAPYPATAFLTGFLRSRQLDTHQRDLSQRVFLQLMSSTGVQRWSAELRGDHPSVVHVRQNADAIERVVDVVIRFLQGNEPTLAYRIARGGLLPEGPRFELLQDPDHLETLDWGFGSLGIQDRARYLATLFLNDLADAIREGIDPRFELVRYGESLAESEATFEQLHSALRGEPTVVDQIIVEEVQKVVDTVKPDVVGISAPFAGNVYGAFRIADTIKNCDSSVITVFGGGFANTELRELREPRVFDSFDYVTLDDGESPLLQILARVNEPEVPLLRTFFRRDGEVVYQSDSSIADVPFRDSVAPIYDGLELGSYISVLEMLNPMHRLWSDGRWNKLLVAHGCYWKKCNFCDVTLDYISRFEPLAASKLVDHMEAVIEQTGSTGFHFVDEAAPPKQLRAMAVELIRRGLSVTWWGNIRFEKTFDEELCTLLAESGCIAVSGGLEVASDRLLQLMNKGVSIDQVARVTQAFSRAGVMVHAYLMYGFPTQSEQETVDALEVVRQLIEADCIQSGFWHRFSATAHSPIGRSPDEFQIQLSKEPEVTFARNELDFTDSLGCDPVGFGEGLRAALYNYMHGVGLDRPVHEWFDEDVPFTRVPPGRIQHALAYSQE